MTLDSLLTVFGLLLAVYAILPLTRRLDLSFRFTFADRLLAWGALLPLIYLQFYASFAALGWTPRLGWSKWGLTPERVSAIVVFLVALVLFLRARYGRLRPKRLPEFSQLIDEQIRGNQALELVTLVKQHFARLRILATRPSLHERARRRFGPPDYRDILHVLDDGESTPNAAVRRSAFERTRLDRSIWRVANIILPRRTDVTPSRAASFLRRLLERPYFADAVAKVDPYFGLVVLSSDARDTASFLDAYIESLLLNRSSVLYDEIRSNQNIAGDDDYLMPEENRVLRYFFDDAHVAHKHEVYRSIGNAMLTEFDRLARDASDPYNRRPDRDDHINAPWLYPLFAGGFLFELMVVRAARQGITWHMWLFYVPDFVERIARNYRPADPLYDPTSAYPTRYALLLHMFIRWMCGWVEVVNLLKNDNPNHEPAPDSDDGYPTIPTSAINALIRSLRIVANATEVEPQIALESIGMVLSLYFRLRERGSASHAASLLRQLRPRSTDSGAYHVAVTAAWTAFDKIPHDVAMVANVSAALGNAV